MKGKVVLLLMVFIVLFSGSAYAGHDQTSTGFYWPIGEDDKKIINVSLIV